MSKCTVCHHAQHVEINQAILSKDFTLAVLSRKYGLHPSSLQRHKNHIEIKMSRSLRRLREIREQGSLLLLNDILEQVRRNLAAADAQGNYLAVFRGSHVASRLIHQLSRLEGDMQPDTLHRLISSPAWIPQAGLLPTDPKLMTGLHQGLLDGAFAPCPEPPPEISGADPDEAAALDTGNSALEAHLATLQRLLPDLDLTLADLPPRTEELPKNQRKISEKSAVKTTRCALKRLQNYEHTPSEKNLPKNLACAPKTAVPAQNGGRQSTRKGGEAQAPPPFPEPATAPSAVSGISSDPYTPTPETVIRKPNTVFPAPPPVLDTTPPDDPQVLDLSRETLDEPQERLDEHLAAELAAYLAEFPPYARSAQDSAPNVGRESKAPPALREADTPAAIPATANPVPDSSSLNPPPGTGPSRPPNFGNPRLFQSMKGNFM